MAELMKDGKFPHNNMSPPEFDRVLPLFSLKGKTAIVSGAGAGIGLAVAQCFAEAGANVAIWYNSNVSWHRKLSVSQPGCDPQRH
jgi:sorbose reductase